MQIQTIADVRIDGVCACLPKDTEDSLARCTELFGDAARAAGVVQSTGIQRRRIAAKGVTSLDLCVQAAKTLLDETGTAPSGIGAVLFVTFTPAQAMPCNACQAQKRLGLPNDILAFDVGLACSGYGYGLFLAGLLCRQLGRKVLLLDGDVQSSVLRRDDEATVPVLADAGTATLVSPQAGAPAWSFAFLSKGEGGAALQLPVGGTISMDGFAVFRFVAMDVAKFIKEFLAATGKSATDFDAFVPHQANVYMIRQLAKSLGFPTEKLCISGDEVGNSASATIPVTMAWSKSRGQLLISGFGGGLSAFVASICLPMEAHLSVVESDGKADA